MKQIIYETPKEKCQLSFEDKKEFYIIIIPYYVNEGTKKWDGPGKKKTGTVLEKEIQGSSPKFKIFIIKY